MDEMASAVDADPVEFRLRHLKDPRDMAVIKEAAEAAANGTRRPAPRKDQKGDKVYRTRHRLFACAAARASPSSPRFEVDRSYGQDPRHAVRGRA